jgi:hypothetical protein
MVPLAIVLLSLIGLVVGQGRAIADEVAVAQPAWTIDQIKGTAQSRPSGTTSAAAWIQLDSGMTLAPGSEITTGEDGYVELVNGTDRVRVLANSHVQLPVEEQPGLLTRILHQIGTVFFEVGNQPGRQFEVDTPYLVAIVKGTKFSTQVTDAGGWVTVTEGVVGVSASASGVSVDVTTGQTATMAAGSDEGVIVGPTSSSGAPAVPGAPVESPSTAPSSSPTESSSSASSGGDGSNGGKGNGKGRDKNKDKGDRGCNGKGNCNGHGQHGPKSLAKESPVESERGDP